MTRHGRLVMGHCRPEPGEEILITWTTRKVRRTFYAHFTPILRAFYAHLRPFYAHFTRAADLTLRGGQTTGRGGLFLPSLPELEAAAAAAAAAAARVVVVVVVVAAAAAAAGLCGQRLPRQGAPTPPSPAAHPPTHPPTHTSPPYARAALPPSRPPQPHAFPRRCPAANARSPSPAAARRRTRPPSARTPAHASATRRDPGHAPGHAPRDPRCV